MTGYALPAASEEDDVVVACRRGDQAGLDLLYRQYAPALVAFCQHRLGTVGDAEDAAHETILKAYRALPRFREGARLWPWLATIAANICTDIQRGRERLSPEQDAIDCHAPEVDEDVTRRLRAAIVEAALDEMPERFRKPLFLREFMGWSYEEIATFSNKSVGSVRTTLMRARRAFQSRVEDVARRQGQWPLPAVVGLGGVTRLARRARAGLRQWRDAVSSAGADTANALWRAEGLLGGLGSGLQAAAIAIAAASTLALAPAHATTVAVAISAPSAASSSTAKSVQGPKASSAETTSSSRKTVAGPAAATTTRSVEVRPAFEAGPTTGEPATVTMATDGERLIADESDGTGSHHTYIDCNYTPVVGKSGCPVVGLLK